MIDSLLQWIASFLADLLYQVANWIGGVITAIANWMLSFITAIQNTLATVLTTITTAFNNIVTAIQGLISDFVESLQSFLTQLWDAIVEVTAGVIDTIQGWVADAASQLEAFISSLVDTVVGWIDDVTGYLQQVAESVMTSISALFDSIVGSVQTAITTLVEAAAATWTAATQSIQGAYDAILNATNGVLVALLQKVQQLQVEFGQAVSDLLTGMVDVVDDATKPILDEVRRMAEAFVPSADPKLVAGLIGAMEGTRTSPEQMEVFRQYYKSGFRDLASRGPVYQTVFSFLFLVMSLLPAVVGIAGILGEISLQEWRAQFPYQLLNPADAASAYRHGLIEQKDAVDAIRRQGYDGQTANHILRITESVPAEQDLLALWKRGLITEPQLDVALKQRGYEPPWLEAFKQASALIPPVQDLIQMAVRDVWNPAAVSLGQMDEGFPAELATYGALHGLTPEWAHRYWQAHWNLPSPNQGFEMLHRGVISETELDVLLQALDVMPGWRPRLKAIAYSPLTRVDVRRMHKLGVLSDDDVTRSYMDLGYTEANALLLTEFTKQLNKPSSADSDEELGKLSRTAVLGFYTDGLLTKERALSLLVDLGHTLEAATLYLNAADLEDESRERKAETDLILELAEAGSITFTEAEDRLNKLGLATLEVQKALTRLLRIQQRRSKLPTRAEAEQMLTAQVIQLAEYQDLLGRLGYGAKWVKAFTELHQRKARSA